MRSLYVHKMLQSFKRLLPWRLWHVLTYLCLQVSRVRLWDGRSSSFPESHDGTPPMGARLILAALLRVRPLDQSGGRDEGSRQHTHAGEHGSRRRDEVSSPHLCDWCRCLNIVPHLQHELCDSQRLWCLMCRSCNKYYNNYYYDCYRKILWLTLIFNNKVKTIRERIYNICLQRMFSCLNWLYWLYLEILKLYFQKHILPI